jgi:hypothetical protein
VGAGNLSDDNASGPVSVDTVFDRFPASVRGAVVARGLDREPHQIRLLAVRVVQAHDPSREIHRAGVEETTIDVAPHKEVVIPFDVPFTELGPGWFCVTAQVEVDGSLRIEGPEGGGKRFGVPWPLDEVRKVDVKPNLKIGGATVVRIRSTEHSTEVRWHPGKTIDAELKVSAGRNRLPVVDTSADIRSGTRVSVAHPLPKGAKEVTLDLTGPGREKSSAVLDLG